jgi:hypothetical protein
MPCSHVKLPDGTVALVRHGNRRFPRCRFCNVADLHQACDATLLCDFVLAKTLGGAEITCDTPVCPHCAKHVGPDKDFCPKHGGG